MKLFATAIDQSVSPGSTMCVRCAEAGATGATATKATATETAYLRFNSVSFRARSCALRVSPRPALPAEH